MFWKISLVSASLVLAACQGENTFQRESDPYKSFQDLKDSAQPYDVNNRPKSSSIKSVPFTQTQACTEPFVLDIEGLSKDGSLEFTAGQQKTVAIKVQSRLPEQRNWDVQAPLRPEGAEFAQVSKSENEAVYKFTWTPAASSFNDESLILRYNYPVQRGCESFNVNPVIGLLVKEGNNKNPVVTFRNLPVKTVQFGESFDFEIKVSDPMATVDKMPSITAIGFKSASEKLNAKGAVDCKKQGEIEQNPGEKPASVFTCSFQTRKIQVSTAQLKKFNKDGKTMTASFNVKAKSQASGVASAVTSADIQVVFEKLTEVAKAQGE